MATSRVPIEPARSRLLWLLIIALAFCLRAAPIGAGLPYLRYIDEGHLLHDAIAMLQRGTSDTGFYNYPALPSRLIAGALSIYAPIYDRVRGEDFWTELQRGDAVAFYDYFAPTDVIVVGRCVVLLFSIGIVVFAGMLGKAIGGTRTGLLSLLLVAICPALVSRGSILIVDTVATFFVIASLYFAQRLQEATDFRRCCLFVLTASAAAGCAFASKYPCGAVFVAVIAAIVLLRRPLPGKLFLLALSGVGLVGASLLAMPALLRHSWRIFGVVRGVAGYYDVLPAGPGYFAAAIQFAEMGIPLVVVSLLGLAFMLYGGEKTREIAISWLVFAIVIIAALVRHPFQPFRNLLSLVPMFCVAAAFLVTHPPRIVNRWIAPIVAGVLLVSLAFPAWRDVRRQRAVVDSRVRAVNWLGKHSRPTDRILAIRELAIHPAEWKRIGRTPTVISWFDAGDLLDRETFDHIVDSQFDLRFTDNRQRWSDNRDRWLAATAHFAMEKSFGEVPCFVHPGVWRTNDERIEIKRATTR